jgi:hypothetical protein
MQSNHPFVEPTTRRWDAGIRKFCALPGFAAVGASGKPQLARVRDSRVPGTGRVQRMSITRGIARALESGGTATLKHGREKADPATAASPGRHRKGRWCRTRRSISV